MVFVLEGKPVRERPKRKPSESVAELPTARLRYQNLDRPQPHWVHPMDRPRWSRVEAAAHMRDDDPVLGIVRGSEAWALPWWIMKNHHVANLELGGEAIVVTFCEACSGAAAFRADVAGERRQFRLVGTYNGTILVADDQSRTLWAPFAGRGLVGPLEGTRLERLPMVQTDWKGWSRLQPHTRVLVADPKRRGGHGHGFGPGSEGLDEGFRSTLAKPMDPRLSHNELVLGVDLDGTAKAYPLDRLGPVLNDTVGGHEIVVLREPGSRLALAFHRRLGGEVLELEVADDGAIVDRGSKSRWSYFGEATSGPHQGKRLPFAPSGLEEWYAWAASFPDGTIHGDTPLPPAS